jgi:hypothetical protein
MSPIVKWSEAISGDTRAMGARVVGRTAPVEETSAPTIELSKVDFPAPVGPAKTTVSGRDGSSIRGRR